MTTKKNAEMDAADAKQRRTLLQVLLLNAALFVGLLVAGIAADSSGLLANALDNLSDAAAYTVSFFAVTRSGRWKAAAASITGVMLLVLAVGVTVDAVRRFMVGSEPLGPLMMVVAVIAAGINLWCLRLLQGERRGDVNMRAAWTMSVNDFASNFGILLAGALVLLIGRNWPDLGVAVLIAAVAIYGGIKTLVDARRSRNTQPSEVRTHP